MAERDLGDAQVPGVTTDRRFMIAYEAAVALATIPLHGVGFRTEGAGHHQTTFLALPLVMGIELSDLADYFDTCRAKRNASAYDRGGQTSESEVGELLGEVASFREKVIAWLKAHPRRLEGNRMPGTGAAEGSQAGGRRRGRPTSTTVTMRTGGP